MGFFDLGLSDVVGGALGFLGGERQNSANAAIADKQMNFQERMSNTSYQRAVGDLKKAGLNPMLAYSNAGATTPQGASYQASDSVSSGMQGYQKSVERKLIESQIDTQREQAALLASQASKTQAERESIENENAMFHLFGTETHREKYNQLLAGGDKQRKEIDALTATIDKTLQDIKTGQSSAAANYATIDKLKALTMNLKLDAKEKEAMARMWDRLGEGGAAAKTFVPFLQLLKSVIGK